MKLIKIKNFYYLLSNEEPKLFEPIIFPIIENAMWDRKSFAIHTINEELMKMYPSLSTVIKTIIASTDDSLFIPKINIIELQNLGIKNYYTYTDMTDLVSQLMDYTKESLCILGLDEREPSEFVDIFINSAKQKSFEETEWEVVTDLVLTNGFIKISGVTMDKFSIWQNYSNWKEKNSNRLSQDYDELVKNGFNKLYSLYCRGRWDENNL